MTLSDAMNELGVDENASPEEARRAYLRLLKTRKPDADPAGFQRLREAYEIVKGGVAIALFDATPVHASRRAPAEERVEPRTIDLPATIDVPAPAPRPDPVIDEVAIACEKLEARAACGDWAGMGDALPVLYDAALRGDLPLEYVGAPTMRAMLGLQEALHLQRSLALGTAFQRFVDASGAERRVLDGQLLYAWALLRELDSLPRDFSRSVRRTIVRAIVRHDLESARAELDILRRTFKVEAAEAARTLRTKFPLLARSFAPPLEEGRSALDRGLRISLPLIVVVVVVRGLIAAIPTPTVFSFQKHELVEQRLRNLEAALDKPDCASAQGALSEANKALRDAGSSASSDARDRIWAAQVRFTRTCGTGTGR